MAEHKATAGGARTGRARVRKGTPLTLRQIGGTSDKPVWISPRRKAFEAAAREAQPVRALIETYGDALERTRRTGKEVKFVVTVGPHGHPRIKAIEPVPEARLQPERTDDLDQALEAARIRGRTQAAEILSGADMLTAQQFATLIGTSRVTVNTKRQNNHVLGLDGAKRGFRFPDWQIGEDGKPFVALPALFERVGGGAWAVYRFLVQHHPELDGLTGRETLRRGKSAQALDVAEGIARGTFA